MRSVALYRRAARPDSGHAAVGWTLSGATSRMAEPKKISPIADRSRPDVSRMVEDIVGCKWSLAVLARVRGGTRRPGALEHSIPGITAKVLNERLRKLARYGIVARTQYAEIPPRVEYALTPFGERFAAILDGVARLQRDIDAARDD
jgi:DNA-binding HxlR family transcriptional regulator